MHVVEQEDALVEGRQQAVGGRPVERPGRRTLEPVEHPRLVPLGLQPAEEPRPGVRQALVVQIHRILGRQQHADAERPPLLQQRHQRRLRRRVRHRRKVAEDLVHVDDGAQARGARLGAHPRHHLVQQQGHEEHPLRIAQVGDREHGDSRLAFRRVEQRRRIQRLSFEPLLEPRRREQPVQPHGQLEPLLRRKKRLEVDDADLLEGRRLHLLDEGGEVEILALAPCRGEQRGQQRVLAARAAPRRGRRATARSTRSSRPAPASASASSLAAPRGAANELRIETGTPASAAGRVDGEPWRHSSTARCAHRPAPHAASPSRQRWASWAANASAVTPARRASSSSIHGRKSAPARFGNVRSRLAMSPLGSMAITGTPSIAASSISDRQRPVLPLPVMPTQTAWVTRSRES